eukprot:jgi/Ulvmu1/6157/UM028_0013.1
MSQGHPQAMLKCSFLWRSVVLLAHWIGGYCAQIVQPQQEAVIASLNSTGGVPALELALYRVNDSHAFPSLQADVHKQLRTFPGFVQGQSVRSTACVNCFGDIIIWASLDSAYKAAKLLATLPSAASFLAAIREMQYFGHALAAKRNDFLPPLAAEGVVVRVSVFRTRDDGLYDAAHQTYTHEVSALLPGEDTRLVLADAVENQGERVELIVWPDAAAEQRVHAALSTSPARQEMEHLISQSVFEDLMMRL